MKGTLSNGKVSIPVNTVELTRSTIFAKIDGDDDASVQRTFNSRNWTFTPEIELPTDPFAVIRVQMKNQDTILIATKNIPVSFVPVFGKTTILSPSEVLDIVKSNGVLDIIFEGVPQ